VDGFLSTLERRGSSRASGIDRAEHVQHRSGAPPPPAGGVSVYWLVEASLRGQGQHFGLGLGSVEDDDHVGVMDVTMLERGVGI
jgi:hypothetical protein